MRETGTDAIFEAAEELTTAYKNINNHKNDQLIKDFIMAIPKH